MIFDFFKRSPQQKLREKFAKEFDKSVAIADQQSKGSNMLAGMLCFYAMSETYASMKKNVSMRKLYNLSDTEYDSILNEVLHQKGRKYISNWDDMMSSPMDDAFMDDIDTYDDCFTSDIGDTDFDF